MIVEGEALAHAWRHRPVRLVRCLARTGDRGAPGALDGRHRWLVTLAVMIATVAIILSAIIGNVALPKVIGKFGIGHDNARLIRSAFLASVSATTLSNGWLVDTFAGAFGGATGVNLLSILIERRTPMHVLALTATQEGSGATREVPQEVEPMLAQDHLGQMLLPKASMPAFRDTFVTVALIRVSALRPVAIMRRRPMG